MFYPRKQNNSEIYEFNHIQKDNLYNKTIQELFENQVIKTPNNIAVVYENTRLTYQELNIKANQLANYLIKHYQIKTEDLIALCLDRSEHILICILAVLKAGGAYVPLDPNYPDERIRYILEDTKAKIVLTNEIYLGKLRNIIQKNYYDLSVLAIDILENQSEFAKENSENPQISVANNNLAYVMYTSGTTGEPKGVMIEHEGVVSFAYNNDYIQIDTDSCILGYSNYTFDGSVFDIFATLINGATLVTIDKNTILDYKAIEHVICSHNINTIFITTALFQQYAFLDNNPLLKIKNILFGGEKASSKTLSNFFKKSNNINLVHVYGPTENIVFSTSCKMNANNMGIIPIGRPLHDKKIYILDNKLNHLPIGIIGELYIGGVGIARGYLNQPQLTAEKFIVNLFQTPEEKMLGKNTRLYKTGDLVRILPDGNLEYIGRNDFQVKIRGHRIELSEIENILNNYPEVQQSVVIALEHKDDIGNISGDKYLVAYYTAKTKLDEEKLLNYLASQSPNYMLPNIILYLERFPLTLNGKIDRKALPLPELTNTNHYIAPHNELETKICGVYAKLLGLPANKISINGDFFSLGGTSILAIRLINQLRNELDINTSIEAIFKYRNIEILAANLNNKNKIPEIINKYSNLKPTEYRLSFAQERLWFIQRFSEESHAYNVPLLFKLSNICNPEILLTSINNVIQRHEILRTLIKQDQDGNAYQFVTSSDVNITKYKVENAKLLHKYMQQEIDYVYKLDQEIPIRVCHYIYNNEHYLSVIVHHIAFDGWSVDIFIRDLVAYYEYNNKLRNNQKVCLELPVLDIQYKDFALWQREHLTDRYLNNQLTYWLNKLEGYEALHLATDNPRPAIFDYNQGGTFEFSFDKELSIQLRKLAKEFNVSLYSVLLSGFYLMLQAYSNQNDIVLGTIVSNRHYLQIENLIGFFVNTVVLRQQIDSDTKLIDFIKQVSKEVLDAQLHQDLPFERLVEELAEDKDTSRHPIFQVMFAVQHFGTGNSLFDFYKPSELLITSKFDLTLFIDDSDEQLTAVFEYATSLFIKESIVSYKETYLIILEQLTNLIALDNKHKQIKNIYYLSKASYQKIVIDYNKTEKDYPKDKTIHQLFEEQVLKTPNNIAIVYEDVKLTYHELNVKANQLANYLLKNYQIKPDDLIALCLDRSEYMIICILAVLKAGGAYVPIDPSYPDERIKYILKDTQTKIVLTNEIHQDKLRHIINCDSGSEIQIDINHKSLCKFSMITSILVIDNPLKLSAVAQQSANNLQTSVTNNNLAYIMYTSGSTGTPKGVMIEHTSYINVVSYFKDIYFARLDSVKTYSMTNYIFDIFGLEFGLTLLSGGYLELGTPLFISLDAQKYDFIQCTPSIIVTKYDDIFNKLKMKLFVGGESLSPALIEKLLADEVNLLISVYGPTETTIWSTSKLTTYSDGIFPVSIGYPISNTSCQVLNNNLVPLPIGAIGELHIGGDGLARGYLNQAQLTAQKFIANPFQTPEEKTLGTNSRLYKTGDLVRMLPDENLEYIGRNDFQVKIRGHRIELGEIESVINKHPEIQQCVVVALEQKDCSNNPTGDKYLVAYYVKKLSINNTDEVSYIDNWKRLYSVEYAELNTDIYKENLQGWNSSYTKQAIDKEEMLEWRDNTIDRIKELKLDRVLEIGSGTGLLLFNLIDYCNHYYATDFSSQAIAYTKSLINKLALHDKVASIECTADKLPFDILKNNYNTVIINSVIQYFPTLDYLERVLNEVINNIEAHGQIFIGDIRDYRLLGCFHYSISKFKQIDNITKEKVDYYVFRDKELLLAPEYFIYLQNNNPNIANIELLPKLGNALNEMNCYRYDAILHVDKTNNKNQHKTVNATDFIKVLDIEEYLTENKINDYHYIKYLNYKIAQDYKEYNILIENNHILDQQQLNMNLNLNQLNKTFEQLNCKVKFYLDALEPLYLNLVIYKNDIVDDIFIDYKKVPASRLNSANNPLKALKLLENQFNQELMAYLTNKLPSYILPTYLVPLNKLPLTYNGKIDRKSLPDPELSVSDNYIAPRNEFESKICELFAQVLSVAVDKIGIKDDFFRIGGNSILAIKLASRINKSFTCNIKVTNVFISKTVENISQLVLESRASFELITHLNNTADKTNLFMIHPTMSSTEVYVSLANKLSDRFSCYGVDNYNLHNENKITDLNQLSKLYIEAIDRVREQTRQTNEPYLLLGWSLGGQIALNIANNLEQKGIKNIYIILLDTFLIDDKLKQYFANLVLDKQSIYESLIKDGHTEKYFMKIINNFPCQNKALKYNVNPLKYAKIILFKAMEKDAHNPLNIYNKIANHVIGLSHNNIDRIIDKRNLTLVNLENITHAGICKAEKLIYNNLVSWY